MLVATIVATLAATLGSRQLDPADSASRYVGSGPAKAMIMYPILTLLYLLPSMLAWKNGSHRRWKITAINVLLGWTVIGWIAALMMAFTYAPPPEGSEPDRPHIPGTPRER